MNFVPTAETMVALPLVSAELYLAEISERYLMSSVLAVVSFVKAALRLVSSFVLFSTSAPFTSLYDFSAAVKSSSSRLESCAIAAISEGSR